MSTDVQDWHAWPSIAPTWAALVERCPHATFFVTAEWVETWLESFGSVLQPRLVVFRDPAGAAIGACVLVRRIERKGPFAIRRVYLNTSGEDDRDSPCIEFNTLLCDAGHERAVAIALRELLDDEPWDELVAPAVIEGPGATALRDALSGLDATASVKPSYHIDLDEIRRDGRDYHDTLSNKERTHLRQSVRKYGELGELRLDSASTVGEALAMLDELAALHQRAWTARGFAGSFASDVFFGFHRRLIGRCFGAGRIQLLRLRAGGATIGVLYNFVYRGKLYFYQCGYDYSFGKRLSPGIVAHGLAVRHAIALGLADYDLMAGDVEYKRKLATKYRELHWLRWQAPRMKMRALGLLRRTRDRLKSALDGTRS